MPSLPPKGEDGENWNLPALKLINVITFIYLELIEVIVGLQLHCIAWLQCNYIEGSRLGPIIELKVCSSIIIEKIKHIHW